MDKLLLKIKLIISNVIIAIKSLGWKRDSSIILFGSWFGEKFADNSRFLYQYLSEHKDDYGLTHVVWVSRLQSVVDIVRNLGYEAYLMDSKESIFFHKTAKYHIICNASNSISEYKADILSEYSWGAIRINLWHGSLGFKNVGMNSNEYLLRKKQHRILYSIKEFFHKSSLYRKFVESVGGWGDSYFLSQTPVTTHELWCNTQLPLENYIEAGTPRVSYFPRMTEEEKRIINYIKQFKKTIIYLPTFRAGDDSFDFREAGKGLKAYLKAHNYLWIEKVHSASSLKKEEYGTNILNLPHDFDINLLVPHVDMMVSDYSSAVGEAMFFYKPVVFYVPDFDKYRSGDRGLVYNFEDLMCGPKARTLYELQNMIDSLLNKDFKPDAHYLDVRYKHYGPKKSIVKIWEGIFEGIRRREQQ